MTDNKKKKGSRAAKKQDNGFYNQFLNALKFTEHTIDAGALDDDPTVKYLEINLDTPTSNKRYTVAFNFVNNSLADVKLYQHKLQLQISETELMA